MNKDFWINLKRNFSRILGVALGIAVGTFIILIAIATVFIIAVYLLALSGIAVL